MLTIKCAKCKSKVFRYQKLGKGRVLRCYKGRIKNDYSVRDGSKVLCKCGNLIGIDEQKWVKMRRASFFHTGTKSNRL
jgi:hypothetical protein